MKKNILFITSSLSNSAFGITANSIAEGLAKICNLSIVTNDRIEAAQGIKYVSIDSIPICYKIPVKISKLILMLTAVDVTNLYWYYRCRKSIQKICIEKDINFIYAYCSIMDGVMARVAHYLSNKTGIPYAVHYCDPIPTPRKCETYELYRVNKIKPIKDAFRNASFLSFNNDMIIRNAQNYLDFNISNKSIVVPDTCIKYPIPKESCDRVIFCYIGRFYSINRTPDKLIEAFVKAQSVEPDIYLQFVGSNVDLSKFNLPLNVLQHIEVVGWTNEVDKYISKSSILIDITLDIEEDFFISSKLKKYLTVDRLILSIANNNSATADFLKNLRSSVICVDHNVEAITKGLLLSYKIYDKVGFEERNELINSISPDYVASKIIDKISNYA